MLGNSPRLGWLGPVAACLLLSGCIGGQDGPREPTGAGIAALRENCLERLSYAATEYPNIKAAVLREMEGQQVTAADRAEASQMMGAFDGVMAMSMSERRETCSCQSAFMYERLPERTRVQLDRVARGERLSASEDDRLRRDLVSDFGTTYSYGSAPPQAPPLIEELVRRCPGTAYLKAFMMVR